MTSASDMPERDPLAMAMIAAWLNVTVEQLPAAYRVHTCEASMAAWQRVAEAARQHLNPAINWSASGPPVFRHVIFLDTGEHIDLQDQQED